MGAEMLVVEIAKVDGAGAVVGELVGGSAADAEGGVGACDYDYFVFDPPVLKIHSSGLE